MVTFAMIIKSVIAVDIKAGASHQPIMVALRIPFPDIGPDIVSFEILGREFALRWYAMAYIVGILIGWWLAGRLIRRAKLWYEAQPAMTPDHLSDFITWLVLGIVLGGRLGFVLFYQPGFYLENPGEILKIWRGGMSFHGGALGVLVAGILFCWRHKLRGLSVGDLIVVCTPPGILLGRIANFINAELWGRPSELPWAVIFPGDAAQACATVERLCARHPSQLYEAALEGLILGAILIWLALRRGWLQTPGALIGVFFAGYGIGRFIVEFFRQPDAQFVSDGNPLGYAWQLGEAGLTMGQLLSLPMIIAGALIVWAMRRRKHA